MAVRSTQRSCASGCSNKSRHGRAAPGRLALDNAEPDLAVALGAARFGKLLHGQSGRITAGAARAVFLQVQTTLVAPDQAVPSALICVLPRNASAEQVFDINLAGLEVRTDQSGELSGLFLAPSWSLPRGRCPAVGPRKRLTRCCPCRRSSERTNGPDAGLDRTVSVRLAAKMNALGLLQISCVSMDPLIQQAWPLEFNLRPPRASHCGCAWCVSRRG